MKQPLTTHVSTAQIMDALPVATICICHDNLSEISDVGQKKGALQKAEVTVNETALTLCQLDPLSELATQIADLKFSIEEPLQHQVAASDMESPIISALSEPQTDRRDLLLGHVPVQLSSVQLSSNAEKIVTLVTLQLRDHRLFIYRNTQLDTYSTELSIKELINFEKLVSQLTSELQPEQEHLDDRIESALAAIGEFTQVDRSYVFLFDFDHTHMSNTHEWVNHGITSHIDELQNIKQTDLPWFFEQMHSVGKVELTDTAALGDEAKHEREEFLKEDIQSILCVGMYANQRLVGFLGFDMVARQRRWSQIDVRRIRIVADLIATAIHSSRLQQSLALSQKQLLATNSALRELALQDGLTGLPTLPKLKLRIEEEIARARRQSYGLSMCVFTLDSWQNIQKDLSEAQWNCLIQDIAARVGSCFRRHGEILARFDSASFAVILPHADIDIARERALKVLGHVATLHTLEHTPITVSAGIVQWQTDMDAEDLLMQAQNNACEAHLQGGDQVL